MQANGDSLPGMKVYTFMPHGFCDSTLANPETQPLFQDGYGVVEAVPCAKLYSCLLCSLLSDLFSNAGGEKREALKHKSGKP